MLNFIIHINLSKCFLMIQALSGRMPTVWHYGWTATSQPPAQSNYKDPVSVTFATACFPELVWQSHLWNDWHWSAKLTQDSYAGEEQVSSQHWIHKQTNTQMGHLLLFNHAYLKEISGLLSSAAFWCFEVYNVARPNPIEDVARRILNNPVVCM